MANLEGMPIGSLPELPGDLQDEDEVVVYRPSTGKAYQANTDLIDSLNGYVKCYTLNGSGYDLNDSTYTNSNFVVNFLFLVGAVQNVPNSNTGNGFVISWGSSYGVQIYIHNSSLGIWFRRKAGGNWYDWVQLYAP